MIMQSTYKRPSFTRTAVLFVAAMLLSIAARPASAQTSSAAGGSVVVAVSSIGNTLDAAVANFTNTTVAVDHIYDRLIRFDENFEFAPAVASAWRYEDATTFVLTLADGFLFQNGDRLTPDDVVYSVERLRQVPRLASVMNNVASVNATGSDVTIRLVEPNSSTIRALMAEVHVYNKAYSEALGADVAIKPMGTGPYKVANFVPGDKLELVTWDGYPFEKPAIGKLTFRTVEENANRYIAVETGEAQFAPISFHDLTRAEKNAKLDVATQRTTNTAFISMNTQKAPFDNRNVRLAMAYATPKADLATVQGGSTVIDSMTPSMFVTYYASPDLPHFDLAKAAELLAQEGYGPSKPLTFETWIYGDNSAVMETYQAVLSSIGVQMRIRSLEFGVFLEGMARGEYQMLAGSWNNITGDPLSALENYWSGSFGSQNISFFRNARVDELYEVAKGTADEGVLKDAAREVQEIAAAEMPIIPTFSSLAIYAFDKRLKGVETFPSSLYSFRHAYLE